MLLSEGMSNRPSFPKPDAWRGLLAFCCCAFRFSYHWLTSQATICLFMICLPTFNHTCHEVPLSLPAAELEWVGFDAWYIEMPPRRSKLLYHGNGNSIRGQTYGRASKSSQRSKRATQEALHPPESIDSGQTLSASRLSVGQDISPTLVSLSLLSSIQHD